MAINLTPETEGGFNIVLKPRVYKDSESLRSKIQKADYALAEDSPGQQELASSFQLDMEDRVREMAQLSEQLRLRKTYQQEVSDILSRAGSEGRALSVEEQDYIAVLQQRSPPSEYALEERFASRYLEEGTTEEATEEGQVVPEEARAVVTKQQIAQRVFEDIRAKYDDTSWARWGLDLGKSIIPFYTWAKVKDRIEGVGTNTWMTGKNIAEQMRGLYFLPADEFEGRLREAVESLAEDNIVDALYLAQAAVSYSSSDEIWDNIFFGLDVADVATLGALGAARGASRLARKTRSLATESANPKMTSVDRKVAQGDIKAAAIEGARDDLKEVGALTVNPNIPPRLEGTSTGTQMKELKGTFGLMDPDNYTRSAGSLSNEAKGRLLENLSRNRDILEMGLQDASHVVRISDEAAARGFQMAEQEFRRTYFRLEDSIVEVIPRRESVDVFGGVDHIDVLIGTKDASGFNKAERASFFAEKMYKLPEGSYRVVEEKGNYFISVRQNVDETALELQPLRLSTNNVAPESFQNVFLGWLRSSDDVLSREAAAWSKTSTYGGNETMMRMAEVARGIGRLGKNESERLRSVMDSARFEWRTVIDPQTKKPTQVQGKFYSNVSEFEQAYLSRGYSLPSEREVEAYFSFRQLMDYDFLQKNIAVRRDKERQAINQKSIGWIQIGEDGSKKYTKTPFFEGKTLDTLPNRSGEPFSIGWYNGQSGKVNFQMSDNVRTNQWEEIEELLSKDYKVIQVANPKDPNLRGFIDSKGAPVQYLVVRDVAEKPLSSLQVPWNEGGHWIYPQTGVYLKQPQAHRAMGRRFYDGDTTAHYFLSRKEAQAFQEAYSEGAQLVARGVDDATLDAFLSTRLPYTAKEFRGKFRSAENPDAPFSLDSPFVVTESGQRVSDVIRLDDVYGDRQIIDSMSSEHSLMGRVSSQYTQERGELLTTINNSGTEANPVYKFQPAPLMDSYEALARGAAQAAKSRYFDDLKHRVVEDWAAQFGDALDVSQAALRADPMRYLREPVFREGYGDLSKIAAAKQSRRALLYILGHDTADWKSIKWAKQKMIDKIARNHGKDSKLLDPWLWDSRADPTVIARSAVFDAKLGMFNFVQYPLQAQAIGHAAAIDGSVSRALRANTMYQVARWRLLAETNAGAQAKFARAASKVTGDDLRLIDEAYDAYKASGMHILEGEFARLDDYLNPRMLFGANGVRKALDAGRVFFKEGNMTHKGVSFFTAFLRWREANPTKRMTALDLNSIVERADLYYVNMSRASNNAILSGTPLSVPTQFYAFHTRLMEQLLGSRLTGLEKARMLTFYSALYGVPVGAGLAVAPFWPVHESVRQTIHEEGIDLDSNAVSKFLVNGAGQMAIEMLTGTDFNFSDRYGPGGMSFLQDLLDGEIFDVFFGASGSLLEMLETLDPFARAFTGVFAGPEDDYYTLMPEDFLRVARYISSINNVARAWYAVNSGKYLTTDGSVVMEMGDVDAIDAFIIGALGMSPQEVSDTYLKIRSEKQAEEAKRVIQNEAAVQFRRAVKASTEGDEKNAEIFYRNAKTLIEGGGFTPLERGQMFQQFVRENRSLMEKVDRKFMLRDPEKRGQVYRDQRLNQ